MSFQRCSSSLTLGTGAVGAGMLVLPALADDVVEIAPEVAAPFMSLAIGGWAEVVLEDGAAFLGGPFFCPNDSQSLDNLSQQHPMPDLICHLGLRPLMKPSRLPTWP